MIQHEKKFSNAFYSTAKLCGCYFELIPDNIYIKKAKRSGIIDVKKPFDGILHTPHGSIMIELKYKSGSLSDHQKESLSIANSLSKNGLCCRKYDNYYTVSIVEYNEIMKPTEGKKKKFDSIFDMMKYLRSFMKNKY